MLSLFRFSITRLFLIACLWPSFVMAQQLPPVTGVKFDGQQILWDEQPGAAGYNVYLDFSRYLDTVRGSTAYTPTESGRYYIAAFDDAGNFSPLQIIEDDGNALQLTNSVSVMLTTIADLPPPDNTIGTVYSITAGEIFWDRVFSDVLEYDIYLNNAFAGSTKGTSFFIDSLTPETENIVSVAARNSAGATSEKVALLFDTSRGGFPFPAVDPTSNPGQEPLPPQNARLVVYSSTAAELFWNRPLPETNIVSTEISRDGVVLGTSPGTSFFDDTREPDTLYSYQLVAIDTNGVRSEPAVINAGPFDGSTEAIVQRLLSGITDVTANNPHSRWVGFLRRFIQTPVPEGLVEVSSEWVLDENSVLVLRTLYNCESGTLDLDYSQRRFGGHSLTFDNCFFDRGTIDGSVNFAGSDLGGFTTNYRDLLIDREEGNAVFNGFVDLNRFRSNVGISETYKLNYSIVGNTGGDDDELDTIVELSQVVVDFLPVFPRTTLDTNFVVNAPWTNGRELTVTTTTEFVDADLGNGNYLTGALTIAASNGDRLELTADTGDASSWYATVVKADGASSTVGSWSDDIRLPCLSFTMRENPIPGCSLK